MKKYVVIVGGELFNKGAQALTFTTIDNLKKNFPEADIILFSNMDFNRSEKEKGNYSFKILPYSIDIKAYLLGGVYKSYNLLSPLLNKNKVSNRLKQEVENVLMNCEALIDISGYALSSQRGKSSSLQYLLNLKISRKYNIPTYLLPQSFGPFQYGRFSNLFFHNLIKTELKTVNKIFAREDSGYNNLRNLGITNVYRSYDIVLQNNNPYNLSNIYNNLQIVDKNNLKIQNNSVCIVPNIKIMKHGNDKEIYSLYFNMIKKLTSMNKNVYILRHSYEDLEIINKIKSEFHQNSKVYYLDEDYSCIDIDNMLKEFDFIIGSRYHSVVHAYKNNVPALVLGWAVKYDELLNVFDQNKYCFDVRKQEDLNRALLELDIMINSHKKEKEIIRSKYSVITQNNIFNELLV